MSEKTYTIAVLKAKPSKINELIEILKELAKQTRQEAGALQYGFYQTQDDPNIVLSYEEWRDKESEAEHWQTNHLQSAIKAFGEILDSAPIIYKASQII